MSPPIHPYSCSGQLHITYLFPIPPPIPYECSVYPHLTHITPQCTFTSPMRAMHFKKR